MTSLIVVIAPGTGTLYTIATGLAAGRGMSFAAAFGCTLGIIPHMLAAITGLAAILHSTPGAFELVKYAGVAWLLYLAWGTLTQRGSLSVEGVKQRNPRQVISHAILINLLNPKLPLFFLAFLPQFYPARLGFADRGNADPERRFYADDAAGFYALRRLFGGDARIRAVASAGVTGTESLLCRRFCRAGD
ncbi:RhtB family transporter [Klebsiella michiganensis]|nr:RhtB family transporter [Klebsiella michiganensis]